MFIQTVADREKEVVSKLTLLTLLTLPTETAREDLLTIFPIPSKK
jgi:hypothetical protein